MGGVEKRTEEKKPLRELPITWVELKELKPHEALNDEELKKFVKSLTSSGVFWLPLLVSRDEKIIIDGHHRWAGLKELGAEKAPAILIDYSDPEIGLDIWYPLLSRDKKTFLTALKENKIDFKIVKRRKEALDAVQNGNAAMVLIGKKDDEAVLILNDTTAVDLLVKIEGETIVYIDTKSAAISEVDSGEARYAIIRKPLSKSEVIATIGKGEVFAAKSTRHILPFEYQKIDVKLPEIIPDFENN